MDPAGITRPCERCTKYGLQCIFQPARPPSAGNQPPGDDDGRILLHHPYPTTINNTGAQSYLPSPQSQGYVQAQGSGVHHPNHPPSINFPTNPHLGHVWPPPLNQGQVPMSRDPIGYREQGGGQFHTGPGTTFNNAGGSVHPQNPYPSPTSYSNARGVLHWITLPFVMFDLDEAF